MKTQKLFKELGWEAATQHLLDNSSIIVKNYDNKIFVLNYNQISSPKLDDYVSECRGLILNHTGSVLGRRWSRFFNYGEMPEVTSNFKFEGSSIFAKADGSTILIWYNPYETRWEISTRGTAFAESGQGFYDSFKEAVLDDGFHVSEEEFQEFCLENLDTNMSYVFEYCSCKNRIVTFYETPQMVLISTIHNETGIEQSYEMDSLDIKTLWSKLSDNVKHIDKFEFDSLDDMVSTAKNLSSLEEGYVAKDINGLRIKIKSDQYVRVHRIKGDAGVTPKTISGLVVENEHEEFLTYFPEYKDMFQPYIDGFHKLIKLIDDVWVNHHGIESQKDFALSIKDYSFKSILFSMRKTEKSFDEIWSEMREEYKSEMLIESMNVQVS